MAEATQYFRVLNLVGLVNASDMHEFVEVEKQIFVDQAAEKVLEAAPDWETEVGGLHEQKSQIEEIFHIKEKEIMTV